MTLEEFGLDDAPPSGIVGGAVAIGNFDGVHRGHHRLLAVARSEAQRLQTHAVALCLYPHPLTLLRPDAAPPVLLWPQRRAALLREAGARSVAFLRTTKELLSLSAEEFFQRVLVEKLKVKALVEGENFRFGRGRRGDVALLKQLCRDAGISMTSVALADDDEAAVSSTRIREAVAMGDLELVGELAGRTHRIRGRVAVGAQRGRTIGFPTANLEEVLGLVPAAGVYAVRVYLDDRRVFGGACNVGPNPTFGEERRKIETHILDFSGDLYGSEIEIEFLRRLRDVTAFTGVDELVLRIKEDVESSREVVAGAAVDAIRPELAVTIAEWVRWNAEAALEPVGATLDAAGFTAPGVLQLTWRFAAPPPAYVVYDLLFALEERLRAVFPEVEHVVSATR